MSKTLSIKDAQAANIQVVEGPKGDQAVHDLVTAYRANRRSGTACTKTRGEVKGSNKKLWKQKGTGRARAGTNKNPVWRGGGIVFGPRPRSYAKTVSKGTRRLITAAEMNIEQLLLAGMVVIVEDAYETLASRTA